MKNIVDKKNKKLIMTMLENGADSGRISLKFPGITRKQIGDIRAEIDKGTEQTKKRLKRDPLLSLFRNGDLEIYDLYGAELIRYAFSLITSDVTLKVMNYDGLIDIIGRAPTEGEAALHERVQNQYSEWFDECTLKRIKVGPIIHLLTEPVTLRDTDGYFGFRHGRTKGYLVKGLKLYVEMFKPRKGVK